MGPIKRISINTRKRIKRSIVIQRFCHKVFSVELLLSKISKRRVKLGVLKRRKSSVSVSDFYKQRVFYERLSQMKEVF